MAKRKNPPPRAESEPEVVLNNPFADLQIEVPEPPAPAPPPPPPPPTREELLTQALSPADQALLKEFAAKGDGLPPGIGRDGTAEAIPKGPLVTLVIQKKGHKGRVVTLAHGLKELTFTEQMELCHAIKTALGLGARFVDGVLELQGDQRQRASQWLSERQFRCRIPS